MRKGTESRFVKSIEKYVTGRVDSRIVVKEHYQAPPKEITLSFIAKMNRDYGLATLKGK